MIVVEMRVDGAALSDGIVPCLVRPHSLDAKQQQKHSASTSRLVPRSCAPKKQQQTKRCAERVHIERHGNHNHTVCSQTCSRIQKQAQCHVMHLHVYVRHVRTNHLMFGNVQSCNLRCLCQSHVDGRCRNFMIIKARHTYNFTFGVL